MCDASGACEDTAREDNAREAREEARAMRTSVKSKVALLSAACVAVMVGLSTTSARADAGVGSYRVGADVGVLSLEHFPNDFGGDFVVFQFGLGEQRVTRPFVHASFAYQILEPLLIGLRAGFGVQVIDLGGLSDSTTNGVLALVPFAEYLLSSGDVRPFLGAQVGVQVTFPERGDSQATAVAGGFGGLHIFATPSFTISPTLMVDFLYRGDFERGGVAFSGLVSLEGWI
jgi:hypothetical protein